MLDQIIMHKLVKGRCHTFAFNVLERADRGFIRCGESERGGTKTELHVLFGIGAGIQQQIMTGDTDIDGATADVDRDIEWTQIEQFHIVIRILNDKLARIAAQTVAGFGQHVPSRLG